VCSDLRDIQLRTSSRIIENGLSDQELGGMKGAKGVADFTEYIGGGPDVSGREGFQDHSSRRKTFSGHRWPDENYRLIEEWVKNQQITIS